MALQEGKPENLLDKIIEGKMKAFFKSCEFEQAFVKEEKSVGDLIKETSKTAGGKIEIVRFVRYQLGETVEEEAPTRSSLPRAHVGAVLRVRCVTGNQ